MVLIDYYDSDASKVGDDNENIDKSKSGSTPSGGTPSEPDIPPTGQKNIDKSKGGSTPSGGAPSKPKTLSTGQRLDTLRLNINALTRTSWLHDCHIEIAIENIRKYRVNNNECTLYFGPSISHLIKMESQAVVETQLNQNDAIYKRHLVFIVNNCKGDLRSGEGSHWSLLIYERKSNTWYHIDSGGSANAPHAKQIRDKVDNCLVKQGNHENSNSNYVESCCTQQQNGYDCGPLMILFAMSTAKKIARGEPLQACWVKEDETHGVRKWIHAELNDKLLDLEKGEAPTNDKINHIGKDVREKSKKTCWFYKHRTCRFGGNCIYWHPPGVRQREGRDRYRDRSYKDHANSHRGPNNSLPDEKYNRHTKKHQYPQRSHPNDNHKHNHNTHFLGNQWDPKNWPTPMEMDQAIKLIRFLQVGSNSWGPVRR